MAKHLVITLGDAAGIGPEIVQKSLPELDAKGISYTLVGPQNTDLQREYPNTYTAIESDFDGELGHATALSGRCAFLAIEKAVSLCQSLPNSALVTAPINKTALKLADVPYTGHTTMLKDLSGVDAVSMAFYTPSIKTILTTIHVPLIKVSELLTLERLKQTVVHGIDFLYSLGYNNPRIAVAGLNPHAGEDGLFGDEEINQIQPAIAACQDLPAIVTGPYPADTVFRQAYDGQFDLVVSMTHDQGLIPIKLLHFDSAVNVTIGLPFVRTSPDHGTAYDIVGTNTADHRSFLEACLLAFRM